MNEHPLTEKQFWALGGLAVLSPLLRLLPGRVCALSGGGAWLSCLVALVPLGGFAALLHLVRGSGPLGRQLADRGKCGRLLLALLTVWFWLYGGVLLRSGAERFLTAVNIFRGWLPYGILLLLMAVPAALHGPKPLFRSAEIFLPVLTAALALSLIAAVGLMDWSSLKAIPKPGKLMHGAVPLWNLGCGMLFYSGFFRTEESSKLRKYLKWLLRLGLTAAAICAAAAGMLGAEVTAKLSQPFFVLLRNLSLSDAFERFEALIVGMWVLPDFAMLSLLLLISRENAGLALRRHAKVYVLPGALVMLLSAAILGKTLFRLTLWSERIVPVATLILTISVTVFLFLSNNRKSGSA